MIRSVFFDVGETIVDETREYETWADWLGVPRHTFSAVFGAVIARGQDYREVFQVFRPGFDLDKEREIRAKQAVGKCSPRSMFMQRDAFRCGHWGQDSTVEI